MRFDSASRALYATDASNYRQVPIGIVVPKSLNDVEQTMKVARHYQAPILIRGGGTSLAGQCCNAAIVLDFTKYLHHVLEIDPHQRLARVQPGCVLDRLRKAAREYQITFGPDPATHNHCTLGGMVGNNSCGMHAQMAGRTSDNIEALEVLTYRGERFTVGKTSDEDFAAILQTGGRRAEIYQALRSLRDRYADLIREKFPKIPRLISGYGLDQLLPENGFHVARALVGSECTCVTVLEITGRLIDWPKVRTLLVIGYPDVYAAGRDVAKVIKHKPMACEGIDDRLLQYYRSKGVHLERITLMPKGNGWLMIEFGGETKEEADDKARALAEELHRGNPATDTKIYDNPAQEEVLWKVRESGLGITAFVPGHPDTWPGWEDSAVPPEKVGDYLQDLRELFNKHGYDAALYGHFGHGCIHCRINFDLITPKGIDNYRAFIDEASSLVVAYGGSLSGEHGDGQARAKYLSKMFGSELVEAFREFKSIWDPDWKMNPGKVIDAYDITDNLRLGAAYQPWEPQVHFSHSADKFSFSRSALRCVGIGECRREEGETMCPSYRVTREEMHATRGRAHLLFEMLRGEVIKDGWKSSEVREALDLCLACKGCKGDCPVNVDMATYKAEFLSHYYEGRLRPRNAYAFGLVNYWAQLGSLAPWLVNSLMRTPGVSSVLKFLAGVDQRRELPLLAPTPFRSSFAANNFGAAKEVLLWTDTFNNYFTPQTLRAAAAVLQNAGYRVRIPRENLCCGRPLYDYGFLELAKTRLRRIVSALKEDVRRGVPIVVLEPSCAAVFKDELTNMLPHDEDARRLQSQVFFFPEFLKTQAHYSLPRGTGKVVLHRHCHEKALSGDWEEKALLSDAGFDVSVPDAGCCGMAGAFGYEQGSHYDVSMAIGSQNLLPAVRSIDHSTLVVADGFSCREQISQGSSAKPLHLAQIAELAAAGALADGHDRQKAAERATKELRGPLTAGQIAFVCGLAIGSIAVARTILNRSAKRALP